MDKSPHGKEQEETSFDFLPFSLEPPCGVVHLQFPELFDRLRS